MGHTNSTANLSLPQFIGTDKPTWLGDVNGAFSAIDSYAGTNDAAVAAAVSDASSAISQAAAAVNTANTANTTAGNASTAANNAIGVANTANAIAGAVDAKVGLLADLHTTDRSSIVNAINELADAAPSASVVEIWTNPDPTQDITTATQIYTGSEVFKAYIIVCSGSNSLTASELSGVCTDGREAHIVQVYYSGSVHVRERDITIAEAGGIVTLTPTNATFDGTNTADILRPVAVYGII